MHRLALLLFVCVSVSVLSCKKETQAKVQTVTVKDTVYVEVHDTTVIPAMISDTTTTFIVLRHAEKESTGTDPNLNSDGILRADELKRILTNVPVSAIYSTPFNRTRQTVQPLAAEKSITIEEYSTTKPYLQLITDISSANRGRVVLVVGHSNTVPDILKELSKNTFSVSISESQYDNLFIVSLHDKLSPKITALKYGKNTP